MKVVLAKTPYSALPDTTSAASSHAFAFQLILTARWKHCDTLQTYSKGHSLDDRVILVPRHSLADRVVLVPESC